MSKRTYETGVTNYAAVLIARGQSLIGHRITETRRVVFIFDDAQACNDIVVEYLSGGMFMDAKELFAAQSSMRSLIWEVLQKKVRQDSDDTETTDDDAE